MPYHRDEYGTVALYKCPVYLTLLQKISRWIIRDHRTNTNADPFSVMWCVLVKSHLHCGRQEEDNDTELTANCWKRLNPGEKSNAIVQLYEETVVNMVLFIVVLVSTLPLNVAGSAMVLTVVPDTPVQLKETLTFGGELNFLDFACHSYVILHTRGRSSPSVAGRPTSHTGSITKPVGLLLLKERLLTEALNVTILGRMGVTTVWESHVS